MDEFRRKYQSLLRNFPPPTPPQGNDEESVADQVYQEGIHLLKQHLDDFSVCETLLHELLFVYPHRPELYYFMGCIHVSHRPSNLAAILYWFQQGFQVFYRVPPPQPYHLENLLDFFKTLFEHNYTQYIQYLMDTNAELFRGLFSSEANHREAAVDPRWLLFLGAYYIKTNRLTLAEQVYAQLVPYRSGEGTVPYTKDLEYKIYNNNLILHTRMANFNRIPELLKRNFEVCHSMLHDPRIEFATKKNVFCSNMLQYDYMYHDPEHHRTLCSFVETYFPSPRFENVVEDVLLDFSSPTDAPPPKIRIGYVSSDFVEHAVSHFILPILQRHDTTRFDVTLFPTQHYTTMMNDPRYASSCQRHPMVNLQYLTTDECVTRIRDHHRIDILVDLNGYTEGHRLDVFARRPAPVQVAYLGFPNTVGSDKLVQYRITDHIADLPNSQQWYAEQRLYLPRGFLLYQSMVQDRPLGFLNGHSPLFPWVVLGAMNRESKNSDEVMTCWRAILQRAPNTKLLIKLSTVDDDEVHMTKYRSFLGVDPGRILFSKYGSTAEYYQLYSCLDVVLDTFPYSGTTTTCNALYNSVPVVTMIHRDLHAHNVSASILTHAGLSEFVAQNPDEYVNKVVELVADTDRRIQYRGNETESGTVHRQFVESMRPEPFMRDYESLLTQTHMSHTNSAALQS